MAVISWNDFKVNPVTAGERLYLLIRDQSLETSGEAAAFWASAGDLLGQLSGSEEFPAYLKGATAVHVTRRILRYWEDEKLNVADEAAYVRNVSSFVRRELFPALSSDLVTKIARAAIEAEWVSGQRISPSCKKAVLGRKRKHWCYLCGKPHDRRKP